MERDEAAEIRRAADDITEAVRELSSTLNRIADSQRRPGEDFGWWTESGYRSRGELVLGLLGAGGMPARKAEALALGLKRHGEFLPRVLTVEEDPTPERVRQRREERRADERERPPGGWSG